MKNIITSVVAVLCAVSTLVAAASAAVTILPIEPTTGSGYLLGTLNKVLPVATVNVEGEQGLVINQLGVRYDGDYPHLAGAAIDLCLLDGNEIVWRESAKLKPFDSETGRFFFDTFTLNCHVAKGASKQLTLAMMRRSEIEDGYFDLRLNFSLTYSPGTPGTAEGSSPWVTVGNNELFKITITPVDSLKSRAALRGGNKLGGFRFTVHLSNRSSDSEEFRITNPAFRLFTSRGKLTDIARLQLYDEADQLLLKKGRIVNRGRDTFIEFPGTIVMPHGQVALFVRGSVGATFKGGATIMLGFVPKDQGVFVSTVDGLYDSPDDIVRPGSELTFGALPLP